MQPIFIDLTRLLGRALEGKRPTGVDRVTIAYVAHYQKRLRILVRFGGRWIFLNSSRSRTVCKAVLASSKYLPAIIRWQVGCGYVLDWQAPPPQTVLLHLDHSGLERSQYATALRHYKLRTVFFLHDLIPITHPEYNRPAEAERHHQRLKTMINYGCTIICNSQITVKSLQTYAAEQAWSLPPLLCAPLAPSPLPKAPSPCPIEAPYFVILGTIEPRKNHLLLLNLWRELSEELGESTPHLVIIGRRGWECEQVVDMLERCVQIRPYVVELSDCDDATLAIWLHHARALLFPSFAEGYGIPPVEALMLGVPVIVSDLPVFHEIMGNIPEYVHPLDLPRWKHLVLAYADKESPEYHAQLIRMQGYRAPTWDEHMARVDAFLDTVI